jgi:DNA-binding NarL/FixJ family response regulator
MRSKKIKVGIADDHQLFRQGMTSLLGEFEGLTVMFQASNGQEIIDQLCDVKVQPDVILIDLKMPVLDGIEATQIIRKKYTHIKIIVITMYSEEEMITYMIENGANGFLQKNEDIEKVVDAIFSVHENGYYFNDQVSKAMIKKMVKCQKIKPHFLKDVSLSEIELEIVKLICRENTNREVATKLSLSTRTVDHHRERILKKIGARNIAGIVMYAVKAGIIQYPEL